MPKLAPATRFERPGHEPALLTVDRLELAAGEQEALEPLAVVHANPFGEGETWVFARDFPQCVVELRADASRARPGHVLLSPRVASALQVTFGDSFLFNRYVEEEDEGFGGDLAQVILVGSDSRPPNLLGRYVTIQEDASITGHRVEKLRFLQPGNHPAFLVRGRVTEQTQVSVVSDLTLVALDDLLPGGLSLMSNDGYEVVSDASTLGSCINLAGAMLKGATNIPVDVDACVLDRAILLLQDTNEAVSADTASEILNAAKKLGALELEHRALQTLGEFKTRVSVTGIRLDDALARVARGECIIVIDGAVFDLTRWLPQHPGGNTIIPQQALVPVDATVFFQIYHATLKSMIFLKHFYLGDLIEADLGRLTTPPGKGMCSPAFLSVLRSHTSTWRITPPQSITTFKSF